MWRLTAEIARAGAHTGVRLGLYLCLMVLATVGAVWGAAVLFAIGVADFAEKRPTQRTTIAATAPVIAQSRPSYVLLTREDWHERIRTREFWTGVKSANTPPHRGKLSTSPPRQVFIVRDRPSQPPTVPGDRDKVDDQVDTYRTVCVRLCDGYFWPVSFATERGNFSKDQAICDRSCGSPTRLYVYPNPGGEPEDMRSIDGEPYTRLPTAFIYRTRHDAQCRCTPQPWEKASLDRHRIYALETAQRKGDRTALKQIADIRAAAEADRRRQALQRSQAVASIRAGSIAVRQTVPQPTIAVVTPDPTQPQSFEKVNGRGFAQVVVVTRPPVRSTTERLPQVAAPARPSQLPSGDVIIMRLGVGEAQDLTRKDSFGEPKSRRQRR